MNLHEYQAKKLFYKHGLSIPRGEIFFNLNDIHSNISKLPFKKWIIKAQIHAGGRGKSNGVRIASTQQEIITHAMELFGKRLITNQTDSFGKPVHAILIEEVCTINKELYISAIIDRSICRIIIIVSEQGGIEVENISSHNPEKFFKIVIDPIFGVIPFQCRQICYKLHIFDIKQINQFIDLCQKIILLFKKYDLCLLEINPLAITDQNLLVCIDSKITVDNNALYRQPKLKQLYDPLQNDERENKANDLKLNYISLNGNIGCMVNGAGLAMATMDVIKLYGGDPANFLDIGGNITTEKIIESLNIILSDKQVKGILINIFGGIVRCDLVASSIVTAIKDNNISIPLVIRLEGNNADLGLKILNTSKMNIIIKNSINCAAKTIIELINR